MELNKLYYFHTVAKYQNVTKAAEELYISQPALTKTIKALEKEMGVELFYKKGRHIHLTQFGEYLKGRTDKMFAIWSNVLTEIEKMKHEYDNLIRLNVLAATPLVTDAVLEYKKINSRAVFHLIQNEEVNCDILITTHSDSMAHLSEFAKRYIFEEKIYLAAPRETEYDGRASISLEEVKDKGFISLSGARLFRAVSDKFCESVGFKPNITFESDSPATVKNIIKAGSGIGFWPEFSWSEFPVEDINLIPITNPVCKREIIVGLNADTSETDTAADFYEFLLNFIKLRIAE